MSLTWRRVKPRVHQRLRRRGSEVVHAEVSAIVPHHRERARARRGLSKQAHTHHHALHQTPQQGEIRHHSRRHGEERTGCTFCVRHVAICRRSLSLTWVPSRVFPSTALNCKKDCCTQETAVLNDGPSMAGTTTYERIECDRGTASRQWDTTYDKSPVQTRNVTCTTHRLKRFFRMEIERPRVNGCQDSPRVTFLVGVLGGEGEGRPALSEVPQGHL